MLRNIADVIASGKTVTLKTLAKRLSTEIFKVHQHTFSVPELYGSRNPISLVWEDGVLPAILREVVTLSLQDSPQPAWLVLDGVMDPFCIEGLNSAMDDSRVLVLANGERITLPASLRYALLHKQISRHSIIFETSSLAVASPATLSRCGTVYLAKQVSWKDLMSSWLVSIPPFLRVHRAAIDGFYPIVEKCLAIVTECSQTVQMLRSASVQSLLDLFTQICMAAANVRDLVVDVVQSCFISALLWSVGATIVPEDRNQFSRYLIQQGILLGLALPTSLQSDNNSLTLFDFWYKPMDNSWVQFSDLTVATPVLSGMNVLLPYPDGTRVSLLLQLLLESTRPLLVVGPTACGKTTLIEHTMASTSQLLQTVIPITPASELSAVRNTFIGQLTRRRKGLLGPPVGRHFTVFIDDISSSPTNESGGRAVIEFVRELVERHGCVDLGSGALTTIADTSVITAAAYPVGGRPDLPGRLLRHFHVISMLMPDEHDIVAMITARLKDTLVRISVEAGRLAETIGKATLEALAELMEEMRSRQPPIGWVMNLRRLWHICDGIVAAISRVGELETRSLFHLWVHECHRVFLDSLISYVLASIRDSCSYTQRRTAGFGKARAECSGNAAFPSACNRMYKCLDCAW